MPRADNHDAIKVTITIEAGFVELHAASQLDFFSCLSEEETLASLVSFLVSAPGSPGHICGFLAGQHPFILAWSSSPHEARLRIIHSRDCCSDDC